MPGESTLSNHDETIIRANKERTELAVHFQSVTVVHVSRDADGLVEERFRNAL